MSQIPVNNALESLTRWWSDMGVDADPQIMRAYQSAVQTAAASPVAPASGTQSSARPGAESGAQAGADAAAPGAPNRRRSSAKKTPADWAREAEIIATGCKTLDALASAIDSFDGCPLKEGATRTVVFDGTPGAPVMVIGEGPGRDEDRAGLPFVGRAGQLLDRMLASISLDRKTNALITNVNYWRPPRNRNPEADELLVCAPFVQRMIALTQPKLIIAAGAVPAKALLGTSSGIMKLRGTRQTLATAQGDVPLMPIFHPAYLLRRPEEKARAWRDLLAIESLLAGLD
ncbi:MAG: uracil-DNA glycosylase [Pseudomonadota bacterium]